MILADYAPFSIKCLVSLKNLSYYVEWILRNRRHQELAIPYQERIYGFLYKHIQV